MRAFLKKEWMEAVRTKRLIILLIVFLLFGIMNPAIAKFTPQMMKLLEDSIAEAGMTVGEVKVNAITCWAQFYKNIPMALIIFVIMISGMLTGEYQKGTLIQVVTKGLSRKKIMLSKMIIAYAAWTACYMVCFFTSYGYAGYFWKDDTVEHLFAGAFFYWLFGCVCISLVMFFSAVSSGSGQVLLGVGGVIMAMILLSGIPAIKDVMPIALTQGPELYSNVKCPDEMTIPAIVSVAVIAVCTAAGLVLFDSKKL